MDQNWSETWIMLPDDSSLCRLTTKCGHIIPFAQILPMPDETWNVFSASANTFWPLYVNYDDAVSAVTEWLHSPINKSDTNLSVGDAVVDYYFTAIQLKPRV